MQKEMLGSVHASDDHPPDAVTCRFLRCIEARDVCNLEKLLKSGFNINAPTAAQVKSKFDPVLPLHLCIQSHWVEGAKQLLEAGADVNLIDPMGGGMKECDYREFAKTPLVRAICIANSSSTGKSTDLSMMDLLAKYKPNINAVAYPRQAPLVVAVCLHFEEAVRWLLEHDADPNIVCRFSPHEPTTALAAALRIFKRYTVKNADVFDGDDKIHMLLDSNYNILELLLSHNADPNIFDSDDLIPVMSAASSLDLRPLKCLLRYGADINNTVLSYNEVDSALVAAVSTTNVRAVALLLDHGVNTNCYVKLEAYWGKKQLFSLARYALRTSGEACHRIQMGHMLLLAGCKYGEPTISLIHQLSQRYLPEHEVPAYRAPADKTVPSNASYTNGNWASDESESSLSSSDEESEDEEDYDDEAIKIVIRLPYEETIDNDMLCFRSFEPSAGDKKLLSAMLEYVTQPKTLKQSCRLCIRGIIHGDRVKQLPIPQALRDYLLHGNIKDIIHEPPRV